MTKKYYTDGNKNRKLLIKKGDKFITKSHTDRMGDAIMTVIRVTNQTSDGYVYFVTDKKIKRIIQQEFGGLENMLY